MWLYQEIACTALTIYVAIDEKSFGLTNSSFVSPTFKNTICLLFMTQLYSYQHRCPFDTSFPFAHIGSETWLQGPSELKAGLMGPICWHRPENKASLVV